jgi:hypothetical protein
MKPKYRTRVTRIPAPKPATKEKKPKELRGQSPEEALISLQKEIRAANEAMQKETNQIKLLELRYREKLLQRNYKLIKAVSIDKTFHNASTCTHRMRPNGAEWRSVVNI